MCFSLPRSESLSDGLAGVEVGVAGEHRVLRAPVVFLKKNNSFARLIDHSFIESPLLLLPVAEQEYRDHDHADHSKTQADDHELVHLRLLDAWKKNKNKLSRIYFNWKNMCQTNSRSRPTCPPTLSRPSRSC